MADVLRPIDHNFNAGRTTNRPTGGITSKSKSLSNTKSSFNLVASAAPPGKVRMLPPFDRFAPPKTRKILVDKKSLPDILGDKPAKNESLEQPRPQERKRRRILTPPSQVLSSLSLFLTPSPPQPRNGSKTGSTNDGSCTCSWSYKALPVREHDPERPGTTRDKFAKREMAVPLSITSKQNIRQSTKHKSLPRGPCRSVFDSDDESTSDDLHAQRKYIRGGAAEVLSGIAEETASIYTIDGGREALRSANGLRTVKVAVPQ